MHRHKKFGLCQGEQQFGLILAGVAGNVYVVHPFVNNVSAQLHQLVYHLADALFIAGNGGGGDNDAVVGPDFDVAVAADAHAGQGAHRLALAAGRDEDDLIVGVVLQILDVDQGAGRNGQVSQLYGGIHHVYHAAAEYRYFTAEFYGSIHHLLHPVDVAGEGGNNDALFRRPLEQLVKALPDDTLAGGGAWLFGVGTVAQQRQHPLAAQFAKAHQVDRLAGNGGEIHLEVTGQYHQAGRGADGKSAGIGDGMVDPDKFHAHGAAGLDGIPGLHGMQLALVQDAVLLQLAADQPNGEGGAVNRRFDLLKQEGKSADVVLVPVGQEDPPHLGSVFFQITEIGDDQIHAGQFVIGESGAAVGDQDILLGFKNGQVFADLAQSAQRNNLQRRTAVTVRLFAAAGAAVGLGRCGYFALTALFGGGLATLAGLLGRLFCLFGLSGGLPFVGVDFTAFCGGFGAFAGRLLFGLFQLVIGLFRFVLGSGFSGALRGIFEGVFALSGRSGLRPFPTGLGLGGRLLSPQRLFDLRRDFSGGFRAAVLAEILP